MSTSELAQAAHQRATAGARRRFTRSLLVAGAWFLGIYALYAVILVAVLPHTDAEYAVSALDTTIGSSRWVAMGLGAGVTSGLLRPHVAAGGSRRSFFTGTVGGALVAGAVYGVVTTMTFLGERALSSVFGMPWRRLVGLPISQDSVSWYIVTPVAEGLVIAVYALVGIAAGLAYQRYGWLEGTLTLIGLLLPAALVDAATGTGVVGSALAFQAEQGGPTVSVALGLAGAVIAVAAAAVAYFLLLRDARLRPPR